jgi:hypothetical protein
MIPFFLLRGFGEELAAVTTFDSLGLYFFGAEWTLL